jgi:hypothetical protein
MRQKLPAWQAAWGLARSGSFGLSGDSTRCAKIRLLSRNFLRKYRGDFASKRSLSWLDWRLSGLCGVWHGPC